MPEVELNYGSKKHTLEDVQRAVVRRMLWSQEIHNVITDRVRALTTICDNFESWYTNANPNSTIAIGYLPGHILVATQGFTLTQSMEDIQDVLMKYYDFDPSRDLIHFITNTSLMLGSSFTGIHAEMMIVRWLIVNHGISKQALSDRGLQIATSASKGCCPNCAGWLNMYSIPHTAKRDKLSGLWRNPVTLNKYMHNTVNPFTHNPQVRYEGFAPGTAEINKAGKVLRAPEGQPTQKTYNVPVTAPVSDVERNMILNVGGVLDDD